MLEGKKLKNRRASPFFSLDEEATFYLAKLPEHHNDPFDRMLVCQAIVNGLTILTPDKLIRQYPARAIW
jgi:PIN domain nuclease of toxin-antitoxin system